MKFLMACLFALAACGDGVCSGKSCECTSGMCNFDCPAGAPCAQQCDNGGDCDTTCVAGGCMQECKTGATCTFACEGGDCQQQCDEGSHCQIACSGGGCRQYCAGSDCHATCTGDGCTTLID